MEHSPIAHSFKKTLSSLQRTRTLAGRDISQLIWNDLWQIRAALWAYKTSVKRSKDWTLSEIFQDLVAHYLRSALPRAFTVKIEQRIKKTQPDIIIEKNGRLWAVIEVKTLIGWNRGYFKNDHRTRVRMLQRATGVPKRRIFYIIESPDASNKNLEFHNPPKNVFILFETAPRPAAKKQKTYADIECTDFRKIIRAIRHG